MKYSRILFEIASQCWAMEVSKMHAMIDIVLRGARGEKLGEQEIHERIFAAKIHPSTDRAVARREGVVAVIPVHGVIANRAALVENVSVDSGVAAERLGRQFHAAMNDPQIKAVVFDMNSPGGTVFGTRELADQIYEARGEKPIVAHVNAMADSGAYWLATAADEIVASPTSEVGSIGVFAAHKNIAKGMEMDGTEVTLISAGKYKVEGNPFGPLEDEARAAIQERIDKYYGMFTAAVSRNMGVPLSKVRNGFGEGRTLLAEDALAEGMIHRIDTLDNTLARFGVGPKASPDSAKVETPRRNMAARRLRLLDS